MYEDGKTESGIITLNEANINEEQDDRFQYKRLFGTVVGVPLSFSDQPISAVDEGKPAYTMFVGHDSIVDKRNRGYPWNNKQYNCSTFDAYDIQTMADIGKMMNVKVGDKVYFDEKVTERENFMGHSSSSALVGAKKSLIFRCPANQIFCKVEGKNLVMQGGWVLVEPDMETWEEITTPSGIIMKVSPEAKALRGWVRFIGERDDLKPGDHIIYINDADVRTTIEGVEYFCMLEEEILSKIK